MWQLTLELRSCSTPLNTVGAELRRLRRGLHWHSVTGRSIDAAGRATNYVIERERRPTGLFRLNERLASKLQSRSTLLSFN